MHEFPSPEKAEKRRVKNKMLVSSALSVEIEREEYLENNLFCRLGCKSLIHNSNAGLRLHTTSSSSSFVNKTLAIAKRK